MYNYFLLFPHLKPRQAVDDSALEKPHVSTVSTKLQTPRLFKRKNSRDIPLRDPKRVYSSLFEFNDPIAKEYYRRLIAITTEGTGGKAPGGHAVHQSIYIPKGQKPGEAGAMEGSVMFAPAAKEETKARDAQSAAATQKSDEAVAQFEKEIEKVSEQEGQVKGEHITQLFVDQLQEISNTVAE